MRSLQFAQLAGWEITEGVLWAYYAVVVAVTLVLLFDLLRGRWAEDVMSGLVVDLGGRAGTGGLRGALGRAIGDRTMAIGYWIPSEQRYADDTGATVEVESVSPGHSVMPIDEDGAPLAVLVYDDAVLVDRDHIEAVAAAARIAVSSIRLQAEAQARVEELEASRRRIVVAEDAQRDRIEHELREGTQARLARVTELLNQSIEAARVPISGQISELETELDKTGAELDELAKGIHPRLLVDGGLAAALPELAARARLPVRIDVSQDRLPERIEAALYFVCSEALTNTAKYAQAATVSIVVTHRMRDVVADIRDDGVGGADPERGSGLQGLTDRIETLGGSVAITSPPSAGTHLRVRIPLGENE